MKVIIFSLFCTSLLGAAILNAWDFTPNYDEAKIPQYTLPDALLCSDGTPVKSADVWEKTRRPEILELFQREMFGRLPDALRKAGNHPDFVTFNVVESDENAYGGKAIRKQVEITFHALDSDKTVTANLLIYIPKNAQKPVPVFAGYNFRGNHTITDEKAIRVFHLRDGIIPADDSNLPEDSARGSSSNRWDLDAILDAGYALAVIHYMDVAFDTENCMRSGIFALYDDAKDPEDRAGDDWGSITAWAWGMSRVMDYIETDPMLDASRVAVMGHSRLGKTSLWTGASDPRFAVVISNDSGCGGAALSRREFGETVARINHSFPHWFCRNFWNYNEAVNDLPMDEHELVALMAPRPVYIASAEDDLWADPYGEYLSGFHAVPVYSLFVSAPFDGLSAPSHPAIHHPVGNVIGYHIRAGKHDVTNYDWEQYIRFADKFFKK